MTNPTPEKRAPFGFKDTTEFVVWLSAERLDIAVKALDAAHANIVNEAVAAERERCANITSWIVTTGGFSKGDALNLIRNPVAAIRTEPADD